MTTSPRRLGLRALAHARLLLQALAALTIAVAPFGSAWADRDDEGDEGREPHAIGLRGDLPYSAVQIATGVPNLIADMNANSLKFTVHDGDLKQGSGSLCDDNLYLQSQAFFNQLRAPAMFTPGDNDWTDCLRPSNGGFNSRERLDRERQIFFSTPYSMGQRQMRQQVQTEALCLGVNGLVPCVENQRWTVGGVTYVTLNVPGSCNNLCDTAPDTDEFAARNAANIKWMKESFAVAIARRSARR
jgi:hypothetical protein